jgi:VanZ family protein
MNHKYAFFSLVITALIICVSSIPDHSLGDNDSFSRQIIFNYVHIPAYAIFTYLWLKSFRRNENTYWHLRRDVFVLLCIILFAFSDELHQSFVAGRTASLIDIGLDLLGILFGVCAFRIFGSFGIFRKNDRRFFQ